MLLLGPTGGGKTTLLRSATRLQPALAQYDVRGSVQSSASRLGYLPQDAMDAFVSFDAENEFRLRARAAGTPDLESLATAQRRIAALELSEAHTRPFHHLSAGERKRVALAAIQANDPEVLLLDEPLAHVDLAWRARLVSPIIEAAQRRLVLLSTHDPAPFLNSATRAISLRGGRIERDDAPPAPIMADHHGPLAPSTQRTTPPSTPLIRIEDATFTMDGRKVLDQVHARLGPGVHALVGPNGSGKTTLLRAIAGLERPARGRVVVDSPTDPPVAFQFDDPQSAFFEPTVEDEIAYAPRNAGSGCDVRARVREALFDLDLESLRHRHPYALSGGQRVRLALACLSAHPAPVLLLDEPTQGLDGASRNLLYALLDRRRPTACIVVATHDERLVATADAVHELRDGTLRTREELPCIPS